VAIGSVLLVARGHVEVELQGVVAQFLDDALGLVRAGLWVGLLLGVTVAVDAHPVAVLAAQKLVSGHFDDFASEVVQCDVDTRDGRDGDALDGALAGHLLDEVFVEAVDVEWVLADEKRRHPLDEFGDAGAPVGLAGTDDARVRVDADQRPREVPVDHGTLDVGDLDVASAAAFGRDAHRLRGQLPHRVLRVRVVKIRVVTSHAPRFCAPLQKNGWIDPIDYSVVSKWIRLRRPAHPSVSGRAASLSRRRRCRRAGGVPPCA
jgi:hypothetical protein